ncbi:thiosulfate oxidation carrier protein SoxY [Sulfurihydrogenibium subterraneum]|uniref:thiosulfate oxidation carrier protein SoxY n=1 Tax=Sulfurihydrogenibium subterraneum TaxID=171121 RepID=UPI00048E4C68|nr:thiosulfate oxidation carrier protein SoxY [Sulfurihydrogenibium subterraneum]
MNRREFLKATSVAAVSTAVLGSGVFTNVRAAELVDNPPPKKPFDEALKEITGGKAVSDSDKVKLVAPEIAENGAVVPVTVEVELPIEQVKAIHILADKNHNARTMSVYFTPVNGKAYISTRIRLAETMNVVAVAQLADGSFIKAQKPVKVTIGGCG